MHVTHKPPCKTRDSHLFPIAACVTISSTCFRIVLVPARGGPAPCAVTATASRGPDVHSPTSCPRTCMVRAFPVNGAAPCVTSCVCVCHRASRFRGSPMSQGEAAHTRVSGPARAAGPWNAPESCGGPGRPPRPHTHSQLQLPGPQARREKGPRGCVCPKPCTCPAVRGGRPAARG